MSTQPWKVSLHGGHSGLYCDHAQGTLEDILQAAVEAGFHTYGVSEHAPRLESRFLYDEEIALGWNLDTLINNFNAYAKEIAELAEAFADRLCVLRGFEAEVVPSASYAEIMLGFKKRMAFDYMVGSVHYVDEIMIDGPVGDFQKVMELRGGMEPLAVAYYDTIGAMVQVLKPEVVGHFDVIKKLAPSIASVDTPTIRNATHSALEAIKQHDCILDLNTAGLRKGLGEPYPAPWIVKMANEMGIGFCFGDDSHGPTDVGANIEEGRKYLLDNGVKGITILTKEKGMVVKKDVGL
jgi:histidinol-phosphatase (PHP family)